jgi:sulfur relay (sulfurtransferase) complex TusBCD TusD component (DsrE family)
VVAGRSLFLGLIGAPYESDLLTTAVRMAEEAARQDHRVTVWACGYATALTTMDVGDTAPRNLRHWDTHYPSPTALITHLLQWSDGRIEWLVCRYCAQERGTTNQIDRIRIRPPYKFMELADAADVSLILGVK